ncbi:MAG: N-acetylmuramoyl-L-alanine amidase [Oceanicaulis sp.]
MKIVNHRLLNTDGTPVAFVRTPNQSGPITPRFLVIHFTAGRSLQSSVDWFSNPDAKASAHLVIGRDGAIVQTAGFNRKAWHAGKSSWNGIDGLNSCSIGIELDNAGELRRGEAGGWTAWFGAKIDAADVVVARHRSDPESKPASGWHDYPEARLDALGEAVRALHARYRFEDVLGHDDIAPGRKRDPGPAFPMAQFKARLLGRVDDGAHEAPADCETCGRPLPA